MSVTQMMVLLWNFRSCYYEILPESFPKMLHGVDAGELTGKLPIQI